MNKSQIKNWYLSLFREFESHLNGEKSSPIHERRKQAIEKFAELDFPDSHQEDWRFTDISPILNYKFIYPQQRTLPPKSEISELAFKGMSAHLLVFVNGFYAQELSSHAKLPQRTIAGSLSNITSEHRHLTDEFIMKQLAGDNVFTALNAAFTADGAYIYVPEDTIMENPIYLLFVSYGEDHIISQPRILIITGKNSQVKVIEHFVSPADGIYFTNLVTEVHVGDNSSVELIKIQSESTKAYHIATTNVTAGLNARYESQAISIGASIYRHNLNVALEGEGGNVELDGLYLTSGTQLSDTHSLIDHAAPHCNSRELYKGILDGKSRGVFNGKIIVRRDARQTNSYQENRNIILSSEAKVDTKPQLEIFDDDVKCSHGATVGQLDKDSLFYLRSRGIGEEQAKLILLYAFARDVLKNIKIDEVRNSIEAFLLERFLKN
jgi:Fe-S cluster assembly protein SufD